ncbi:MAG TPA: hypothetical protein VLX11_07100 [Candidatus Acidoferrales bacterium]|nr:hypothetical protein [Candidatus Acidoferrales bacterium]
MKAFLMHRDRDFSLSRALPWNEPALTQDLELNTLFGAMAQGDKFLLEIARQALLSGLNNDQETILYRQSILQDCLKNPAVVRELYDTAVESIERRRKSYFSIMSRYAPTSILHSALELLQIFIAMLKQLRHIADKHGAKFESEGFRTFFAMLQRELADEYFATVENYLKQLQFRGGVLISAELGKGNKGSHYVLRKPPEQPSWMKRIFAKKPQGYTYRLHPRDETGPRVLTELKGKGLNLVADALAQSADHILSFFNMLQIELAFYVGCLNLHQQLAAMATPISFPLPMALGERSHSFNGLYDVCLALSMKRKVVGNDVNADGKDLAIVTGANQGGKSTFLRSVGLSQLMMQCGMFAPAEFFCGGLCDGLFTHYKREEDSDMRKGKFDEELSRMSDIVDHLTPHSIVLFNESFAATNEREGSEIARQIVNALLENRIKVFFVTHLYEFATRFYDQKLPHAIFLRAERHANGARTFKLIEGEPLQTSYGEDLYRRIFGNDNQRMANMNGAGALTNGASGIS